MLYTLPNPLGMDFYFQGLQSGLYNRLCSLWGVAGSTYNCFGRAQRNPLSATLSAPRSSLSYIPEWFDYATAQYVDGAGNNTRGGLFFEDTLAALSYFVV